MQAREFFATLGLRLYDKLGFSEVFAVSQSQSVKRNHAPRSITPGFDLWYSLGIGGCVVSILVPHPVIVNLWVLFFLLPVIALFIFGIFGAVLGALGCK